MYEVALWRHTFPHSQLHWYIMHIQRQLLRYQTHNLMLMLMLILMTMCLHTPPSQCIARVAQVGASDAWRTSVVGMLALGLPDGLHDMTAAHVADAAVQQQLLEEVLAAAGRYIGTARGGGGMRAKEDGGTESGVGRQKMKNAVGGGGGSGGGSEAVFNAPKIGDHVLSFHTPTSCYYMSTVVAFSPENLSYEVAWDDGDPSGRHIRFLHLPSCAYLHSHKHIFPPPHTRLA